MAATPAPAPPRPLTLQATLTGHAGAVWCAAWSPAGDLLASAGADACVRLWAPPPGWLDAGGAARGAQNGGGVGGAPAGGAAAAAGWTCLSTVGSDVFPRTVRCVAWSPDGRYVVEWRRRGG